MCLPHDGASPDFSIEVTKFLKENYEGRWIGRNGPVAWPARSPVLNPLHFFLLCGTKSRVYHTGKPEGRHQPVEATNESILVSATNWLACSGNIKRHKDWQHAYSVMAGISKLFFNNLKISILL